MNFWDNLKKKQAQYEADLKNAVETGKETGWVKVRQSEVDLRWRAERSDAQKFEKISGRPRELNFATAAELVEAMNSYTRREAKEGAAAT